MKLSQREAEMQRRSDLSAYARERTRYEQVLFADLSARHADATRALEGQLRHRRAENVEAAFKQRFPRQADGTRRIARTLATGGAGALQGMTAFMSGAEPKLNDMALMLAAADVVANAGAAFRSRFDNFYFFSPENRLIMYTPDRPDKIAFYRDLAPATFDVAQTEMMRITLPRNNPERAMRCTKLLPLLSDTAGQTLTTGCMTPIYIDGEYVGAWGTTLPLDSYLLDAVREAQPGTVSLIADATGALIAYPGFNSRQKVTAETLRHYEARYGLAELLARLGSGRSGSGVTTTSNGAYLVAYGRIQGPDWYFITVTPTAEVKAAAIRSATPFLLLGLLAAAGQAIMTLWWTRRLVARPLAELTEQAISGVDPVSSSRMTERRDEIGLLSRALTQERAQKREILQGLEARVAQRTQEAERANQAKSVFLANMSHEIRTPLTAVIGFSSLLKDRPNLDAEARKYSARIDTAGRALLSLINNILDFSKLESGELQLVNAPTNIYILVRETLSIFQAQADAKGIKLAFENNAPAEGLHDVDPQAIRQILTNLIGNAVKFTEAGGVTVALRHYQETLSISVTDTGPGLSAADQEQLFKRFSQVDNTITRAHGGTGLGLAICKGLAAAMGGEITVSSQRGKGATFVLHAPARRADSPEEVSAGSGLVDLERVRVLVADDNAYNRELVVAILEGAGARVTTTSDGRLAVEAAQSQPFDVILMDLRMPGMDGRAAAAHIRSPGSLNQLTPILAFSADVSDELVLEGFSGAVSKPLTAVGLLGALSDALVAEP